MTKSGVKTIAILVVGLAAVFFVVVALKGGRFGGGLGTSQFGSVVNATSTCGVGSSIIIASSSARHFLYFANNTSATIESVCFGPTCVAGQGFQLGPNASGTQGDVGGTPNSIGPLIPVAPENLYPGPVSCIVNSGTSSGTISYVVSQ